MLRRIEYSYALPIDLPMGENEDVKDRLALAGKVLKLPVPSIFCADHLDRRIYNETSTLPSDSRIADVY
ncbi:unnamed protein product [Haemonchus placei]|uniref:Bestrophin homolog n=1 Tax=Haemonchus placei TaxID=6290 RepID=A0A0N4WWX6_HAEPC|nr:unnamed protein product [Haemonchus placei]